MNKLPLDEYKLGATQNDGLSARKIFANGLKLDAYIGCYDHEQGAAQPVTIDFEVEVAPPSDPMADQLEDVMCYNRLIQGIKAIIEAGHIKLVETLAERIADLAIAHPLAIAATVRVAKPNAIEEAICAGVEVRRVKGRSA